MFHVEHQLVTPPVNTIDSHSPHSHSADEWGMWGAAEMKGRGTRRSRRTRWQHASVADSNTPRRSPLHPRTARPQTNQRAQPSA